jgi:hypothetical protein
MKPMAKVIDIKAGPITPTNLAATVETKLNAARQQLAELDGQVGAAALAASLDEPGAGKRLADLNGRLETARRDVAQLEGAHRAALDRDAHSLATWEACGRRAQLDDLQRVADARLKAMGELCAALETAAKAYTKFIDLTDAMAVALPTGVIQHQVIWRMADILIEGRGFPATFDVLVGAEMFRHAADPSRALLPGGRPPTEAQRLQPGAIEPASEAVRRMNDYVVGAIRERFEAIERADAARFLKTA